MSEYQDVLVLWLNGNEKGAYFSLKNVGDKPITIQPGEQVYLSPGKRPLASKSVKNGDYDEHPEPATPEEEHQPTNEQVSGEDISNDVPF